MSSKGMTNDMARGGGLGDLGARSKVFRFSELPVRAGANGGESPCWMGGW